MKNALYLSFLIFLCSNTLFAQNVGVGTASPAGKLDISSANDGVLIPRVALTAINVAAPLTAPTQSELVYNTATAGAAPYNVIPGFYYWGGTQWEHLSEGDPWREFTLDIPSKSVLERIYHTGQVVIGFKKVDGFNGIAESDFDASSDARLYVKGNIVLGDEPDTDPLSAGGIGNFGLKFNSWRSWWNGDKISAKIMTDFSVSPGCGDTRVTDIVFSLDPGTRGCTQEVNDPTVEAMRIEYGGNVGIGTASPTAKLSVNGSANKPGGGSWAVFSDARLKENVSAYTEGLSFIKQVQTVNFSYNDKLKAIWGEDKSITGKVYQGVIAQDLQKIAPDMVRSVTVKNKIDATEENYLEVDPNKFTYALINAVKEQQTIIESQQLELEAVKLRLSELTSSLGMK